MSAAPIEHVIEVLENSRSHAKGGPTSCVLGRELRFDRAALERCANSHVDDLDVDLLVVLASVAFADRHVRRRRSHWERLMTLSVPVHLPSVWKSAASLLVGSLHDVTGDTWELEFRARNKADTLRQLFLPKLPREFRDATIVPYSGGLDSFAALARHRLERQETPLLLVHARRGARAIHSTIPERDRGAAVLTVPFTVSGGPHAEATYRTRTLIFFSLAALAWRRTNAGRIWIPESGLGCLGPGLVPFGVEHPSRGCHPAFVANLQELFSRLWGARPPFEFPHLWMTKGEVLRQLAMRGALEGWQRTRSCSRNVHRQHPSTNASQCGLCSACLFRRQSLMAAGLVESRGTYFVDVLHDAELPHDVHRADREAGVWAVVGLDELASAATRLTDYQGPITEIALALRCPQEEVASRLGRLLQQHTHEWRTLLDHVPAGSWVRSRASTEPPSG
jgi:hypothetical protein